LFQHRRFAPKIGATTKVKKEVDALKKIVFLLMASILVLGLFLVGCPTTGGPEIIIGVAGPMTNIQGVHMLNGAELAAAQINAAGGIAVPGGTENYTIKIVSRDTDEIDHPENAAAATSYLINNKDAQFIIGGFRTEAVSSVIADVILDEEIPYFVCGSAAYKLFNEMPLAYGALCKGTPYYPYATSYPDSGGYEYIFRATPFNDIFLVNNCFLMFVMVAKEIQDQLGLGPYPWASGKVRVAVLAEDLDWTTAMIDSVKAIVGGYGAYFGWEFANNISGHTDGVWKVNDKNEPNMNSYLNDIADASAHIIFTILSGPVGVQFGTAKGTLDIPAVAVGINVEGQAPGYWVSTDGECEYEITMGTWAPNLRQTTQTDEFIDAYDEEYGLFPLYTAASYDMVLTLADAFTAVGTDKNDVIDWLENIDNAHLGAAGNSAFYPVWDGSTAGMWKGYSWPAINATTQLSDYYDAGTYSAPGVGGCNFTMPPYTTHDLVYGPWWDNEDPESGWQTGIAIQWQDVDTVGTMVGIWPNENYGPTAVGSQLGMNIVNTISRAVSGLNWTDMEYEGTEDFVIPAAWITAWGG
jgi:branched-chain amino acid transport system substrate-binding protein